MDLSTVYAQYLADEERTRQRNIVLARNYYAGEHAVKLTDRQKELLREFDEIASSNAERHNPKAKSWMNKVKDFFSG